MLLTYISYFLRDISMITSVNIINYKLTVLNSNNKSLSP